MTFYTWSTNAAANDVADGSVNWQEGQSPGTVNGSGRGMMAALAKFRDDNSGLLKAPATITAGTTATYVVISNQVLTGLTPITGQAVCLTINQANAASATLKVDSTNAFPIHSPSGTALAANTLIAGTPYQFTFSGTAWILNNQTTSPFYVPIGAILPYAGGAAPNSSFALCFGQLLTTGTTYTALRDILAATSPAFPYGGNATAFNLPDLRGRVLAAPDNLGGSAANRIGTVDTSTGTDGGTIVGSTIGSHGGTSNWTQSTAQVGSHTHTASVTDPGHVHSGLGNGAFGVATLGANGVLDQSPRASNTGSATTGITVGISTTAAANAMAWLQPTIIIPYIIRVL